MIDLHRVIAFAIPAGFAVVALWVAWSFVRNRPPHDLFWRLVAVMQVVTALQIVIGAVLFVAGSRVEWRHYAYGGLFPIAVLVGAHQAARGERFEGIPHLPFGIAGLLLFGLTVQAIRTGFGT